MGDMQQLVLHMPGQDLASQLQLAGMPGMGMAHMGGLGMGGGGGPRPSRDAVVAHIKDALKLLMHASDELQVGVVVWGAGRPQPWRTVPLPNSTSTAGSSCWPIQARHSTQHNAAQNPLSARTRSASAASSRAARSSTSVGPWCYQTAQPRRVPCPPTLVVVALCLPLPPCTPAACWRHSRPCRAMRSAPCWSAPSSAPCPA